MPRRLINNLPFILLVPFFYFLFRLQMQRVSSFGCFDDCFNYMAGYFMLKGKILYSQIFFNHQMLMAYISFVIQKLLQPKNIYSLLIYHRVFGFAFATFMDMLLIIRFKKPAVGFVVIYELTKHYVFGDRFLAEAFIVYPLVYVFAVMWEFFDSRRLSRLDLAFTGFFIWFVIFSREPYTLLALVFLILFLAISKSFQEKIILMVSFVVPSLCTLLIVPFGDYFFNIVTVNSQTVAKNELISQGSIGQRIFDMFAYPVWSIFQHKPTLFGNIVAVFSLLFISLAVFILLKLQNKYKIGVIFSFFILGLANIRFVFPGTIYYEAFHEIVWYGLFLSAIFLFSSITRKKLQMIIDLVLGVVILYVVFSPSSYIWEKVNRQTEFVTNYGNYVANGSVINILSESSDNVFLDGLNDLIYWQADRTSYYKYAWFTSVMPSVNKYSEERKRMLNSSPPDFYFGYCPKNTIDAVNLPDYLKPQYKQFFFSGKPTCLYIKKTEIQNISLSQWTKVKEFGYYLPSL